MSRLHPSATGRSVQWAECADRASAICQWAECSVQIDRVVLYGCAAPCNALTRGQLVVFIRSLRGIKTLGFSMVPGGRQCLC